MTNNLHRLAATYLGGHPEYPKQIDDGSIVADETGLRFLYTKMENMLPKATAGPGFAASELRGISIGTGKVKRKGRAMAIAVGGVAGAAVHAARSRGMVSLLVLGEGTQGWTTMRFAVPGGDAEALIAAVNNGRRNRGEEPLPAVQ